MADAGLRFLTAVLALAPFLTLALDGVACFLATGFLPASGLGVDSVWEPSDVVRRLALLVDTVDVFFFRPAFLR